MRRPEEIRRELVRQWLDKAEDDYQLAVFLVKENRFPAAACFHCQQAVEKFLKAFLVFHEVDFPKTHVLGALLDLVAEVDPAPADELREITALNPYGIVVRYPDEPLEVSIQETHKALEMAGKTREAMMKRLKAT